MLDGFPRPPRRATGSRISDGAPRALALLAVVALASAQAAPQTTKAPTGPTTPKGVEILAQARPSECTVGDPVHFDFEIRLPRNVRASFPQPGDQIAEFTVLEFHPGPELPEAEKPQEGGPGAGAGQAAGELNVHRARVVAAVYRVGEFELPALPLTLTYEDGKEARAQTPAVKLRVLSVLTDQDQAIKDLKKQAEIQEPARWIFWLAVALTALLIASLALWWWARRRHRQSIAAPTEPLLDPFDLADAELRDLLSRGLPERGFVKPFYVALSEIVKKILEAGYQVPTMEKTSGEILESLRETGNGGHEDPLQLIEALFRSCDLVKFAKYVPSRSETETAVRSAQELLRSCRRMRIPPAAPSPADPAGTP